MSDWSDEFYWLNHPTNGQIPRNPPTTWQRDLAGEGFAQALIGNVPVSHPNGLESTVLPFALGFDATEDNRLITRTHSRAIYSAVFKHITERNESKILVTGAPGIGKSRNLAHLLKLFLEANRIALYHAGCSDLLYAFIPPPAEHGVDPTKVEASDGVYRYRCYITTASEFYKIPINNLTSNKKVTLLYDPPKARDAEPPIMQCAVVIAASPNPRHYANFTQNKKNLTYSVNMFTLAEVETFFAIVRNPTDRLSSDAVPGAQVPTFETPCGPVPSNERFLHLSAEHLRRGVFEVGLIQLV